MPEDDKPRSSLGVILGAFKHTRPVTPERLAQVIEWANDGRDLWTGEPLRQRSVVPPPKEEPRKIAPSETAQSEFTKFLQRIKS